MFVDQVRDLPATTESEFFLSILRFQMAPSSEIRVQDDFFRAVAILTTSLSRFGYVQPVIDCDVLRSYIDFACSMSLIHGFAAAG